MGEDKKKGKPEKLKRCIRTAAGSSWEDPSLLEWDAGEWTSVWDQAVLSHGEALLPLRAMAYLWEGQTAALWGRSFPGDRPRLSVLCTPEELRQGLTE